MSSRTEYEKPKPIDFYKGDIAKNYESYRKPKKTWMLEHKAVEDYLDKMSDIHNVLDVPFGTGRFVPIFLERKLKIYGVEISKDMVNMAREILKEDFSKCNVIIGDALDMPFEDKYFDVLVCTRFFTAIIPFGDVLKSLKEFSRVTKKYLILEMGQRDIKLPRERFPAAEEKMAYWFYPDEIKEMLGNVNIEILESIPVAIDQYMFLCKKNG